MKTILSTKKENIDKNEVTVWYIEKGEGAIIINLNRILNEDISQCTWLGNSTDFLEINYSDRCGIESIAIFDNNGQVISKGIESIEQIIEEEKLFIVSFTGYGIGGEDALYYNLAEDEIKMAVIDSYRRFIVEPIYDRIKFDENEKVFYSKNYSGEELSYTLKGEKIKF